MVLDLLFRLAYPYRRVLNGLGNLQILPLALHLLGLQLAQVEPCVLHAVSACRIRASLPFVVYPQVSRAVGRT